MRKASPKQSYNKIKRKVNLKIKKNPLARVAFRIFALCLCLLASTAHVTAQEVVYELVTSKNQLVASEKYIIVDVKYKTAMGYYEKEKRRAASLDKSHISNDRFGLKTPTN